MKTGPKAILATAGIALVVSGLLWPRDEPSYGMSVGFLRYGEAPYFDYASRRTTNGRFAYFGLTNTGDQRISCHRYYRGTSGVFAEVLTTNGWEAVLPPWRCLAPYTVDLAPGGGLEVPVLVVTNLSWRTRFSFRPIQAWETIPFIKEIGYQLPDKFHPFRIPVSREVLTDPVPAPGDLWPKP